MKKTPINSDTSPSDQISAETRDGLTDTSGLGRRRMLGIMATSAVAVPVLGLSACGSDDGSATAPAKAMQDSAEAAMDTAEKTMADAADSMSDAVGEVADDAEEMANDAQAAADDMAGDMQGAMDDATADAKESMQAIATDVAQVDENGPQAMGLGYRHDATTIDSAAQTRYQAGQKCSNCALYQGGSSEWGGCPLFAGQQVKATGWCSAYAAAA